MMKLLFYKCRLCGQIIGIVEGTDVPIICCGQPMEYLEPNITDGMIEKHVPIWKEDQNIVEVQVGETPHPMTYDHYIQWIAIRTEKGTQRKELKPGMEPKATFALVPGDKVLDVYEYCNLHELWKG